MPRSHPLPPPTLFQGDATSWGAGSDVEHPARPPGATCSVPRSSLCPGRRGTLQSMVAKLVGSGSSPGTLTSLGKGLTFMHTRCAVNQAHWSTSHSAQPSAPHLGVPLPQFQHHKWWAVSGILRVLVQKEVLEDECLGPCGGCRAPQGLGALAMVQKDQPNEGPWRVEGKGRVSPLS